LNQGTGEGGNQLGHADNVRPGNALDHPEKTLVLLTYDQIRTD
jgi:hypothetical protein